MSGPVQGEFDGTAKAEGWPPTPGMVLARDFLEPYGISVGELADHIGMDRLALLDVLSGERPVTPRIAVRLAGALGTSAEYWLAIQAKIDVRRARLTAPIPLQPAIAARDQGLPQTEALGQ